jgi:hypothetical protein
MLLSLQLAVFTTTPAFRCKILPVTRKGADGSACRRDIHGARNIINSSMLYQHATEFCRVPELLCPIERGFLFDYLGLRVPAWLDCCPPLQGLSDKANFFVSPDCWFNGDRSKPRPRLEHPYYTAVPDRWSQCNQYVERIMSGWEWAQPQLPVVDEEYGEQVTLLRSLIAAADAQPQQQDYYIVEAGARWGTWGWRAMAMGRLIAPKMRIHPLFYEPSTMSCMAIEEVAAANDVGMNGYQRVCGELSTASLLAETRSWPWIDYLDMDIQGSEISLCTDRELIQLIVDKVMVLKIGVHVNMSCAANIDSITRAFSVVQQERDRHHFFHADNIFRERRDWAAIRGTSRYHESPQGPVSNWDGEIVLQRHCTRAPRLATRGLLTPPQCYAGELQHLSVDLLVPDAASASSSQQDLKRGPKLGKGLCTASCTCTGEQSHGQPGRVPCGAMCCKYWHRYWNEHPERCANMKRARPLRSFYCG